LDPNNKLLNIAAMDDSDLFAFREKAALSIESNDDRTKFAQDHQAIWLPGFDAALKVRSAEECWIQSDIVPGVSISADDICLTHQSAQQSGWCAVALDPLANFVFREQSGEEPTLMKQGLSSFSIVVECQYVPPKHVVKKHERPGMRVFCPKRPLACPKRPPASGKGAGKGTYGKGRSKGGGESGGTRGNWRVGMHSTSTKRAFNLDWRDLSVVGFTSNGGVGNGLGAPQEMIGTKRLDIKRYKGNENPIARIDVTCMPDGRCDVYVQYDTWTQRHRLNCARGGVIAIAAKYCNLRMRVVEKNGCDSLLTQHLQVSGL
jgi:hypothetical protein